MGYYHFTDYSQDNGVCPHCKEKKVLVKRFQNVPQLFYLPIKPGAIEAEAVCRKCNKVIWEGEDAQIDLMLQQSVDNIQSPKWMWAGAILLPLTVLGIAIVALIN